METGTLKALNVKPGDVVELVAKIKPIRWFHPEIGSRDTIDPEGGWYGVARRHFDTVYSTFRIISRASDTPKTWGEMTDAERRDISFAAMSGKTIELLARCAGLERWLEWDGKTPLHLIHQSIRVRPEPVRETVTLSGYVDESGAFFDSAMSDPNCVITFDKVNGKPDWSTLSGADLS